MSKILQLLRGVPALLHDRADTRRFIAYGHHERMLAEGLPPACADRQIEFDLAVANLLDAIAASLGWKP